MACAVAHATLSVRDYATLTLVAARSLACVAAVASRYSARPRTEDHMRGVRWAIGIVAVFTLAACAPTRPAARHAPVAPAVSSPRTRASTRVHVTRRPPEPKVIISRFRAADGTVVTLARFAGPVRYRLHSGSQDPGSAALSVVRAGPGIGGGERRRLLAAFNGGFLLSAGAGGGGGGGPRLKPPPGGGGGGANGGGGG